jgi:hypothetical protein
MEQFRNRYRVWSTVTVCLLLILAAAIVSLVNMRRDLCYCIHGFTANGHEAMWYTNNYEVSGDTVYYFNSDGSRVDIMAPCTIVDNCED